MKYDLNDMLYFVYSVDYQGYTAAAQVLGVSKSLLSRRIAALEESLGVRLVQRSTRRFTVTELGQQFAEQCRLAIQQGQAAIDLVNNALAHPRGRLRISAPVMMAEELLSPLVSEFLKQYPDVVIEVLAVSREVDLINEGVDIAFRPSALLLPDSGLHARQLSLEKHIMVCSPGLQAHYAPLRDLQQLSHCPALLRRGEDARRQWRLVNAQKEKFILPLTARLITNSMRSLMYAAMAGVGVGFLPSKVCMPYIEKGDLCHLFPEWSSEPYALYAVYESRRGQTLLFKTFLGYINQALDNLKAPFPPIMSLKPPPKTGSNTCHS